MSRYIAQTKLCDHRLRRSTTLSNFVPPPHLVTYRIALPPFLSSVFWVQKPSWSYITPNCYATYLFMLCVLHNVNALGWTFIWISTSGRPISQPIIFIRWRETPHRKWTKGIYPWDAWHVLIKAANYFLVEVDAENIDNDHIFLGFMASVIN